MLDASLMSWSAAPGQLRRKAGPPEALTREGGQTVLNSSQGLILKLTSQGPAPPTSCGP